MHTVVETPSYLADAKTAGLSESERYAVVEIVANNPEAGDEIRGTRRSPQAPCCRSR